MNYLEALLIDWSLPPEHERSGFMREALDLDSEGCIKEALAYCAIDNAQPEAAIDYLVVVLARMQGDGAAYGKA